MKRKITPYLYDLYKTIYPIFLLLFFDLFSIQIYIQKKLITMILK